MGRASSSACRALALLARPSACTLSSTPTTRRCMRRTPRTSWPPSSRYATRHLQRFACAVTGLANLGLSFCHTFLWPWWWSQPCLLPLMLTTGGTGAVAADKADRPRATHRHHLEAFTHTHSQNSSSTLVLQFIFWRFVFDFFCRPTQFRCFAPSHCHHVTHILRCIEIIRSSAGWCRVT